MSTLHDELSHVGADLDTMREYAAVARGARPTAFSDLRGGHGVDAIAAFVRERGALVPSGDRDGVAS